MKRGAPGSPKMAHFRLFNIFSIDMIKFNN